MSREVKGYVGEISTYPAAGCKPGEAMLAIYLPVEHIEGSMLGTDITVTIPEEATS